MWLSSDHDYARISWCRRSTTHFETWSTGPTRHSAPPHRRPSHVARGGTTATEDSTGVSTLGETRPAGTIAKGGFPVPDEARKRRGPRWSQGTGHTFKRSANIHNGYWADRAVNERVESHPPAGLAGRSIWTADWRRYRLSGRLERQAKARQRTGWPLSHSR